MSVTVSDLGKRVIAETGLGGKQGEGVMVAFADFPTATINLDSGEQISWAAHLCRASLGADHMKPVETHCSLCREPFEGSDWLAPDDHGVGKCIDAAYYVALESTKAQPAPAPREISDSECDKFIEDALFSSCSFASNTRKIARYAIRQIESRAPQTAPRDPYKRGQLLP